MTPESWVAIPLFLLLIAPGLLHDFLQRRRRAVAAESGFREASRIVLVSSVFTLGALGVWLAVRNFRPRWTIDPAALIGSGAADYAARNLELLVLNVLCVTGLALVVVWLVDRSRGGGTLVPHSAWREAFRAARPDGTYALVRVVLTDERILMGRVQSYTDDLATEGRELILGPPLFSGKLGKPVEEWNRAIISGDAISHILVRYPPDPEVTAAPRGTSSEVRVAARALWVAARAFGVAVAQRWKTALQGRGD